MRPTACAKVPHLLGRDHGDLPVERVRTKEGANRYLSRNATLLDLQRSTHPKTVTPIVIFHPRLNERLMGGRGTLPGADGKLATLRD